MRSSTDEELVRALGYAKPKFVHPDHLTDKDVAAFWCSLAEPSSSSSSFPPPFAHLLASTDPLVVFALQVINLYFRWVTYEQGSQVDESLGKILRWLKQEENKDNIKNELIFLMNPNTFEKFCLPVWSTTAMRKTIADIRRTVRQLTAQRIVDQLNDNPMLRRKHKVQPDVNFFLRVAEYDGIRAMMARLNFFECLNFYRQSTGYGIEGSLDNAVWHTYLSSCLNVLAGGRLITLNPKGCTCRAKCFPATAREHGIDESYLWDNILALHGLDKICAVCHLPPTVGLTTGNRGDMMINPTSYVTLCPHDGGQVSALRPLLTMEYERKSQGVGVLMRYRHGMMVTNWGKAVDDKTRGGKSQIYGLCYGGKRTCWNKIRVELGTASEMIASGVTVFDRENVTCRICWPHDSEKLFGPQNTDCISRFLTRHKLSRDFLFKFDLCRGCKIAIRCYHFDKMARSHGHRFLNRILWLRRL